MLADPVEAFFECSFGGVGGVFDLCHCCKYSGWTIVGRVKTDTFMPSTGSDGHGIHCPLMGEVVGSSRSVGGRGDGGCGKSAAEGASGGWGEGW